MNSERILFAALVVVAILGAIPQLANPVWLTILVLLGLVGGAMAGNPEPSERVLVYVLAGSLPYFSNNLDLLDNLIYISYSQYYMNHNNMLPILDVCLYSNIY